MDAPSGNAMPEVTSAAIERVRRDAANTMQHTITSDLSARLMCRVGVHDLAQVLAWAGQFQEGGA